MKVKRFFYAMKGLHGAAKETRLLITTQFYSNDSIC